MLMYLAFTVQTCRLMCVVSLCCVIVIVPRTFLLRYSSKIYSWYKKYILLVAIENQKLMDLFYCTSKEGSVGGQTVVVRFIYRILTLSSKLLMM